MFVKKLVEKASSKKPGGNLDGLKASDVEPRLVFHYGIPLGSTMFAYDSIQKILALSTRDGQIKLFGKDNTQALLESKEAVPSKFLRFIENQGFLLNVTSKNLIEVWDIEKKLSSHVHVFKDDITACTVMQHTPYIYVGDSVGNISILKLEQEPCKLVQMKYTIPLPASRGEIHPSGAEVTGDTSVTHILPQPTAESKRVLIIFKDGLITLWEIRESKPVFTTGGLMTLSLNQEAKKVTSACWACPFGSKVAVGYSNGDILIWSILSSQNLKIESASGSGNQTPIYKLNLGYKLEKIPIESLRWVYADGKASRLYVMGASDVASANAVQVVLLNEHTESRTVKLGLQLPEPCVNMELISSLNEQRKYKQDSLLLLGKSGHIYAYDDFLVEKYLLQYQSRSPPSLPREIMVKMPFVDSNITVARFITDNPCVIGAADEDYILLAKSIPALLLETKPKDGAYLNAAQFGGFSKVENLYITGHSNGAINFWDAACPLFIPILSLQQQSEDDFSLSGIPVTALCLDGNSLLLIAGDQSGMVRIFRFRPEPYATDNSFMSFQGSTKKRNNHIIQSVNLVKVDGAILTININRSSRHLAVGSDTGYVSVIDIQGCNIIYQKHIASEICTGIISLQFECSCLHGFEKNILVIATKDSSLLALDADIGNTLSTSMVHPKKPSKALFMQILDGQGISIRESNTSNGLDLGRWSAAVDVTSNQLSVLLCAEKAAYVYSLVHAVQGVKKVQYKKKFQSSCCWASTFYSPSDVGLMLLFNTGKIEIRSLPELSLIKETAIRGFTHSASKLNSLPDSSICSSKTGDLVVVNGDQEILVFSVLFNKKIFRILDPVSRIFRKDLILSLQENFVAGATLPKEKKKGIFSSVIKEVTGSKAKHAPEAESEKTTLCLEDLVVIFSTANFYHDAESSKSRDILAVDEEDIGLDIDDIDLEDPGEKPKEHNMLAALNKQNFASKFNAFKGKLKHMKVKSEKSPTTKEEPLDRKPDNKPDSVDQIKKRYGFSSSDETTSVAKITESKLHDNLRKLQGINQKTTEMQGTAKSFSSMANEVLRIAEQGRRQT